MNAMEWHPRYHGDALSGMERMTLVERGAYTTLLDMIYQRGGPVPDEDRMLAGMMLVSVRAWKTIRSRLIETGKIVVVGTADGPALHNERARKELETQSKLSRKRAESGGLGGNKSAEKRAMLNENKGPAQANGAAKTKHNTETETLHSEDKSSDAVRVVIDHDRDAWNQAVTLLTGQGGMAETKARPFFGRLLAVNNLEARDLLPSLARATVTGTQDPQGYLTKAASAIAKRRDGPPVKQKRVTWV